VTEEQNVGYAEDETAEDVEGHELHEGTVQIQRPILYLDEAAETDEDDL
jgi:hypothetical protein